METLLNRRFTSNNNNFLSLVAGSATHEVAPLLDLKNPATGFKRGSIVNASSQTVKQAITESCAGYQVWKDYTPALRAIRLLELVTALENESFNLATAESLSTGKPLEQSLKEVSGAIDVFRFYAGAARTMQSQSAGKYVDNTLSMVTHEPVGVWGVILPWNYPIMMLAWRLAPILASGNTAVVKPALTTPDTALMIAKIASQILPNVVQVIVGDDTVGQELVLSNVDGLAFTGSALVGHSIAALRPDIKVSLELGGNGACIVLPDAPLFTAERLVMALIYNAGQSCAAPARIITVGHNGGFIDRLTRLIKGTHSSKFGPLNNLDQKVRLQNIISNSEWKHAEYGVNDGDGYHVAAQLYLVEDNESPLIQEELFAPVFTIQEAANIPEALRLANSVGQALSNSVWTRDINFGLQVAQGMTGGESWVNCHLVQSPELPHSGRKGSGNGTDLSAQALMEYTKVKTITVGF